MALIMDSAAHTRDRLDRIRDTEGREKPAILSRKGKAYTRRCQHGRPSLKCELCERDRKIEVLDRLCHRQSEILTGIAVALRGEPDESTAWSHHDLVERAQDVMREIAELRRETEELRREIAVRRSSPPTPSPPSPPATTDRRLPAHSSWMTRLTRTLDRPMG